MDKDHLIAQFVERHTKHKGKRIDNTRLIAGSPMHYYCRHCDAPTETLPELHRERPITVCAPCQVLVDQSLMLDAERALSLQPRSWTERPAAPAGPLEK